MHSFFWLLAWFLKNEDVVSDQQEGNPCTILGTEQHSAFLLLLQGCFSLRHLYFSTEHKRALGSTGSQNRSRATTAESPFWYKWIPVRNVGTQRPSMNLWLFGIVPPTLTPISTTQMPTPSMKYISSTKDMKNWKRSTRNWRTACNLVHENFCSGSPGWQLIP